MTQTMKMTIPATPANDKNANFSIFLTKTKGS